VVGATMKLFCYGDDVPDRPCCSLDSINDARRVCQQLGIAHYVLNLESRFSSDVIRNFVDEYSRGRTPIPCVRCNTFTKFRDLLHKADVIGADFIATGHYVRALDGRLLRGVDRGKDQSYFLWGIDRGVLSRMLTPVGDLTKADTRARARNLGLAVIAEKEESQEICFVPDGDYTRVLRRHLGDDAAALSPGPIELSDGTPVGVHDGFAHFTIGQRRRLPGGFRVPMFVTGIDPQRRAVIVGEREELQGHEVRASAVNWLGDAPGVGDLVEIQVRHRSPAAPAEVLRLDGGEIELALQKPIAAIAPGQSLVIYRGDVVLGGGVIDASVASRAALPLLHG
jgi:tRNA-specific 2-thiouridylase